MTAAERKRHKGWKYLTLVAPSDEQYLVLNFYASQGVCLAKLLSHLPKTIEFYLYIQVPNVTSKNVSWLHFIWPTLYISRSFYTCRYVWLIKALYRSMIDRVGWQLCFSVCGFFFMPLACTVSAEWSKYWLMTDDRLSHWPVQWCQQSGVSTGWWLTTGWAIGLYSVSRVE